MSRRDPSIESRGGYTLMELLIVIIIMITLVAITLPVAKKIMEDGHVREASRQLNTYFAMAKARAVQTGRPCGLDFVCAAPLGDNTGIRQVTQMFLAEVPPHYAGGTLGARGRIMQSAGPGGGYEFNPLNNSAPDQGELAILLSLINDGDQFYVRFDYKGTWFLCRRNGQALQYVNPTSTPYPPAMNAATHPGFFYQIMRQPQRIGNPLELPAGTCIDLTYSGMGSGTFNSSTGLTGSDFRQMSGTVNNLTLNGLTLLFSTSGGMEGYYAMTGNNRVTYQATSTMHFLIGKPEKMNLPTGGNLNNQQYVTNMFDPAVSNLADPTSLWISVGRSNGTVVTAENVPPARTSTTTLTYQYVDNQGNTVTNLLNPQQVADQGIFLMNCRLTALGRQQMAGR